MIDIILPAYQEVENLKNIIPKIHEILKNIEHQIFVIDTMLPMDNTKEVCEQNKSIYVPRENGNFYGDAIRTGFSKITGEYVVIMDADGSHNPEDILKFYKCMTNTNIDLVIGSRYCKGGYTDNNFILKMMSWALNVTYRIIFRLKVKDVSDSFRMYRTEQVKQLHLECSNFDIVEEILIKLNNSKKGYQIKEIPISFNKRDKGVSKRSLIKFIFSYFKTMYRLFRMKK